MAVQISGNDITVPRDGSFTRNVTIGGTLTYEDVTNVDSIGIITARSTIDAQGAINLADSIIHTGDTNTKIRFPAADTITAETAGSERLRITSGGLVGVGQATPTHMLHVDSSSASDSTATAFFKGRIIRFDGAAASHSPRLNLSLDGTDKATILLHRTNDDLEIQTLTASPIRFSPNSTEKLRITSGGVVVIGHTDATTSGATNNSNFNIVGNLGSATGEGQLNLWKRTAPSADNVLGQINFCGDTSGDPGAVIKAEAELAWDQGGDTSDHPSRLIFSTVPDNSSVAAERLRIDSNGFCIQPFKYQLIVSRSGNLTGYDANGSFGTALIFNNIVLENKDSALSSCFDTSTGLFTAPVEGIYFIEASAYSAGVTFSQAWFTVSGSRANYSDWVMGDPGNVVNSNNMRKLSATATVGFHPHAGGGNSSITINASANHTWMRITFIG